MNWLIFALTLGGLYLVVFVSTMLRRGWSTTAALGWQIGLLRFEGRALSLGAICSGW